MGITNRTKDVSEQRDSIQASYLAVATGVTLLVAQIPYNASLDAVVVSAQGLSGAPTYDLRVWRFIVGTGVTTIAGGATTLTPSAMGTSGPSSMVLAASGSSFLNLLSKDVLTLTSGVSNTAVTGLAVSVVIKALQDIRTSFGV